MYQQNMPPQVNPGLLISDPARLLTVAEAATYTSESVATWRRRILLREVPVVKLGANVRIRKSDLDAFVAVRLRPAQEVAR